MQKKGSKTLLMSVLMSAPGPLLLGVGLLSGRSSTQIADFVRRSIELLAIIASFAAYRITARQQLTPEKKRRLERRVNRFVGAAMLLAGLLMLGVAMLSGGGDKGNVLYGLIIAFMGVIANAIFWLRYRRLSRMEHDAILAVQSRLYRAKTFVDLCVTAALLSVLLAPGTPVSYWLDMIGSAVVAVYLAYSGGKIIADTVEK